ncbi:hypothetical protein [Ligilactobacillus aviarius]|uniref:hypothetical protein n=1 Tax=Ligilactobacillus aviarius TaxID=1606 RepID=UPI0024B9219B|nr:hypothetical protein [Ligilactobacillus aviarius]
METQDKKQIMLFKKNIDEHMEDFEQDIKTSPVNAYEDVCKARMALNEVINLFLTQGYVED